MTIANAHIGVVIKGKLAYRLLRRDRRDDQRGRGYYARPGHLPYLYAGAEVVEFSPRRVEGDGGRPSQQTWRPHASPVCRRSFKLTSGTSSDGSRPTDSATMGHEADMPSVKDEKEILEIDGREVRITSRQGVLPERGETSRPGQPLSAVRRNRSCPPWAGALCSFTFPERRDGASFFQKRVPDPRRRGCRPTSVSTPNGTDRGRWLQPISRTSRGRSIWDASASMSGPTCGHARVRGRAAVGSRPQPARTSTHVRAAAVS